MTIEQIERNARERMGFLMEDELRELATLDRLRQVLIRFDEGRCMAPAQDVAGLIETAERGGWHVRDVSLPTRF